MWHAAILGIMNNGNDPPACTLHLEFSDETHQIVALLWLKTNE